MNATDRADTVNESSLVRAVSHQPYSEDLVPLRSVHTHASQHAHFADSPPPPPSPSPLAAIDIEHVPVDDDPRLWSRRKKNLVMALMTAAVLGPMISPSIYNPVVDEVRGDLHGTETQIGLSLSLYILLQGCVPVLWASTAEIIGRKIVYITSFIFLTIQLYTVSTAVASRAHNMQLLIGMRCLQAMGSSAVLSVGAGSLADMFEVRERGRKLGLYYGMPMLGPTLGPLIGGALGNAYGWRSTMYFLAVFAFIMTVLFLFFPDTWRRERSRVYQKAVEDALKRSLKAERAAERKRQRKLARGLASTATTPAETRVGTPASTPPSTRPASLKENHDVEKASPEPHKPSAWRRWVRLPWTRNKEEDPSVVKPSFVDVNPVPTMISIFKLPTNAVVLVCSGLLFAAQYTTTYTAAITFARPPYDYNPLIIGVIVLAFGVGNIVGSVLGGRASDHILKHLAAKNGGKTVPEMRLKSTLPGMPVLVASYFVYGWTSHFKTNVAGPVVALFFAGFSISFMYSSTLVYLVDSNPGRSSSAVSCNSFCRGVSACVMSQVAIPIQNAIGDGGLYSLFGGILCIACAGITLIAFEGEKWRSPDHKWPWTRTRSRQASIATSDTATAHTTGSESEYSEKTCAEQDSQKKKTEEKIEKIGAL